MPRLFVAIDLPEAQRQALARLSRRDADFHWVNSQQYHLTLRFLGEVEEPMVEKIQSALETVRVEPFILPLEGVGFFPPRPPANVIWVGVGNGHPRLHQLRQQLDDAILRTGLPLDVRTFHPHVTIARVSKDTPPLVVTHFIKRHREFAAAPWRVEAVKLYASELQPAGAVHTILREYPLHAGQPV